MENRNASLPSQKKQNVSKRAAGLKELLNLSEDEITKYFSSLDTYRTHISVLKNERAEGVEEGYIKGRKKGREEGIVIGREEGMAIGREEERDNLDKKYIGSLFSQGMNANEIANLLGLEMEFVKNTIASL